MKYIFAVLLFLGVSANAQGFKYSCQSQNQGWGAEITIDASHMRIPAYIGKMVIYDNHGEKGGSGRMKDNYVYVTSDSETSMKTYYVQPQLLKGGGPLRGGDIGGYIFGSWEENDYIRCVAM